MISMSNAAGSKRQGVLQDLKRRLFFLLFGIFIYRLGSHVPLACIDLHRFAEFFTKHEGGILGLFNIFAGGNLQKMTIFSLGIMPYISSSIIIQLFGAVIPSLEQLRKEGAAGRSKLTRYTRYLTLGLSIVQALGVAKWLSHMDIVTVNPGLYFYTLVVSTLTAGTMFLMWMGEQMTERGVGNGISMIIFAGIVARFPFEIGKVFSQVRQGQMNIIVLLMLALGVMLVTGIVVFIERGQRKINVNYARRQVGRVLYNPQSSSLPLKLNMSGVIPAIFTSGMLMFVHTLAQWFGSIKGFHWLGMVSGALMPGKILHVFCYSVGIMFFCYFYTALVFNPREIAENLKKSGAVIPGIRPGEQTATHIDTVITKLTFFGAIYMILISLMPDVLMYTWNLPIQFGGTSLLIVVVVLMEFMAQVQTHLLSGQYDSLLNKQRPSGLKGGSKGLSTLM